MPKRTCKMQVEEERMKVVLRLEDVLIKVDCWRYSDCH